MRHLLWPVLVCCILVSSSVGTSFAQTVGPQQQVLGIYAQVEIQDSSGDLVSYIETSHVTILNPAKFNLLVDQNIGEFKSNIIDVGGQNLQILKVNDTVTHTYPTIVSQNLISMKTSSGTEVLVTADHDGYAVVKGDKVTTYWTIIRTFS